jgi:hypothetical protein
MSIVESKEEVSATPSPSGRGWSLMGGDRGKWHFFGYDSRSLCGKWAEMSRNILERDVHSSNQCAACRRKFEKKPKGATP